MWTDVDNLGIDKNKNEHKKQSKLGHWALLRPIGGKAQDSALLQQIFPEIVRHVEVLRLQRDHVLNQFQPHLPWVSIGNRTEYWSFYQIW
jgi:hypothetical protein